MLHFSGFNDIYCTLSSTSLTLLILIACLGSQVHGSLTSSVQKLKIPDLIPITSSTATVKVQLNGNDVKPGDSIPARSFKNLDFNKIHWDVSNYDARYTMMLIDLDRKLSGSNATWSIYNQYTNVNIPGNLIHGGQAIVAFDPPSVPCHPSTKHRLVLLVFHQDETLDIGSVAHISASTGPSPRRENFNLSDFMSRFRLDLVAANVFFAIGESGGICSGSTPTTASSLSILISMVMLTVAASATASYRKREYHYRL